MVGDMDRGCQREGELPALKEIEARIESGNLHDPNRPVPWVETVGKQRVTGHY